MAKRITLVLATVGAVAALALLTTSALADGYCGADPDQNHACGLTSGSTYNGQISQPNESDYYVLTAPVANTNVHFTLADHTNPACAANDYCGFVMGKLYDSAGNQVDATSKAYPSSGGNSTATITFDETLPAAGDYYFAVIGDPGSNATTTSIPVPYSLSFASSNPALPPTVQVPANPSAACVSAHKRVGADRARIRRLTARLHAHHATSSRVKARLDRLGKRLAKDLKREKRACG